MTRCSIAALYREQRAKAESEQAERRKLVLAHEDLAKRLTLAPIGLADPKQWTGFIPPFMIEGAYNPLTQRNSWVRNPSPQRVHLVALCHEAYARTFGEKVGRAWLDEINTNAWADDWSPTDAIQRAGRILERSAPKYPTY